MEQPTKREVNSAIIGGASMLAVALIIWGANELRSHNTFDPELQPITQAIEKLTETQQQVVQTQAKQATAYSSLARSRARSEIGAASNTIAKLSAKDALTTEEQTQLDSANDRLDAAWSDLESLDD